METTDLVLNHGNVDVATASKEEVIAVVRELRSASIALQRLQFAQHAGMTHGGERDMYDTLGYDRVITDKQYRARYHRGGIAGRVVDALPKAVWRGGFELTEDEDPKNVTDWEKAWEKFDKRVKVAAKLQRAHILSGLSTYSVVLIGAPGDLSKPLPKGDGTLDKILYLMPFAGGGGPQWMRQGNQRQQVPIDADVRVEEYDKDPKSARFGLPTTYKFKRTTLDDPAFQKSVHWSRVLHIADNVLDDEVFGSPILERVWNLLDDLDKTTGGGAEAFWLRANQGLNIDIDKDHNIGDVGSPERIALADEVEKYRHNMTRIMKTQGAKVTTLGSDVANFQQPADTILTQIAGATSIPKRILTGSEMGELASSQDRENWRDQVVGVREGFAEPFIVRPLVDRLIEYNYMAEPAAPYEVRFATIITMTEEEKHAGVNAWAEANSKAGQPVFDVDHMRDYWYGFDPLDPAVADKMKEAVKPEQPQVVDVNTGKQVKLLPDGSIPKGLAKPKPALKAAGRYEEIDGQLVEIVEVPLVSPEERELLLVLEAAITAGNTEIVDEILGMRNAGGPGSGNFGHSGGAGGEGNPGGSQGKATVRISRSIINDLGLDDDLRRQDLERNYVAGRYVEVTGHKDALLSLVDELETRGNPQMGFDDHTSAQRARMRKAAAQLREDLK